MCMCAGAQAGGQAASANVRPRGYARLQERAYLIADIPRMCVHSHSHAHAHEGVWSFPTVIIPMTVGVCL